jgi:hypothetical protein
MGAHLIIVEMHETRFGADVSPAQTWESVNAMLGRPPTHTPFFDITPQTFR